MSASDIDPKSRPQKAYFGAYNGVVFLKEGVLLSGVCDRGQGKAPIRFNEFPLQDLQNPPREERKSKSSGLTIEGPWSPHSPHDEPISYTIAGRSFELHGTVGMIRHVDSDFSRELTYRCVSEPSNLQRVILTVSLPAHCRYRVELQLQSVERNRFELGDGTSLEILTELPWRLENSSVFVETKGEEGDVAFLVSSLPISSGVSESLMVVAPGWEKTATVVRAALGRGFVPCFVADQKGLWRDAAREIGPKKLVAVGPVEAGDLSSVNWISIRTRVASSVGVLTSKPKALVVIPDKEECYGPGLHLALIFSAGIVIGNSSAISFVVKDELGTELRSIPVDHLLGKVLPPIGPALAASRGVKKEVVYAENSLDDLSVCQAIGYADLFGLELIFIPPIAAGVQAIRSEERITALHALEKTATEAVPLSVRQPQADTITVFTRRLPLHLTKTDDGQRWANRYFVAHLPGSAASLLVPRFVGKRPEEAPPVTYTVVFDALSLTQETEAAAFEAAAGGGLSYPITLRGKYATRDVLREVLTKFETKLVLVIAHGSGDQISSYDAKQPITASGLATWPLRSHPLVINNSCSSWHTTGTAFLRAGALGMICTLWQVDSALASDIAQRIAIKLEESETIGAAQFLRGALTETKTANDEETFTAYFYVGLPHAHTVIRPPIDQQEMLHLLSASVSELFSTMAQIADEGRPDLAVALQNSTLNEIRARFQRYLVPKELPPLLPAAPGISVLDIDYWLSFNALGMCLSVAQRIPSEERGRLNDQMEYYVTVALRELNEWEARHDRHNGTTPEQRMAQSKARGIYSGALSEVDWYRHAANLTIRAILPFCRILAEQEEDERIRSMDHIARLLVTRQDDLSSDGTVADAALIRRIREGIPQQYSMFSFEEKAQNNLTIDILGQAVNKSDLANLFGVVRRALKEPKRAIDFFKLAGELAEDDEHRANAESNLANALRESGQSEEALKQFLSPLKLQLSTGDYHNAAISFQNMIFTSATTQQEVPLEMLEELLEGVKSLSNVRDRAESLARVLSAVSIYHAAFKRYEQAERWAERFIPLLDESYPPQQVFRQFDGLAEWYHRLGDNVRSAEREFANAKQLVKSGHKAEAARSYATAAIVALKASEGKSRELMSFFLEASVEAAHLFPAHPNLMQDINEIIRGIRANVEAMLEHFNRVDELDMAAKALRAHMAWEEVDKILK